MSIMHTIDEQLDVGLEDILVFVETGVHVVADLLKLLQDVDRRLLVACWRVLQIGKCAMKLEGLVVIVDETSGDVVNKWDIGQTFEDQRGVEERVTCISKVSATLR